MTFVTGILNGFRKKKHIIKPIPKATIHPDIYKIKSPEIKTGDTYFFTSDSGLRYEVRFGKIKDSLKCIINFSVLNEEYEDDEYADTNKGEIYRVVATVVEIARIYMSVNIYTNSYEFSGKHKVGNESRDTSIRTELFYRTALRILDNSWDIKLEGNKVVVKKPHL